MSVPEHRLKIATEKSLIVQFAISSSIMFPWPVYPQGSLLSLKPLSSYSAMCLYSSCVTLTFYIFFNSVWLLCYLFGVRSTNYFQFWFPFNLRVHLHKVGVQSACFFVCWLDHLLKTLILYFWLPFSILCNLYLNASSPRQPVWVDPLGPYSRTNLFYFKMADDIWL